MHGYTGTLWANSQEPSVWLWGEADPPDELHADVNEAGGVLRTSCRPTFKRTINRDQASYKGEGKCSYNVLGIGWPSRTRSARVHTHPEGKSAALIRFECFFSTTLLQGRGGHRGDGYRVQGRCRPVGGYTGRVCCMCMCFAFCSVPYPR